MNHLALSPFGKLDTFKSVSEGLKEQFQISSGIPDTSSLSSIYYLKYQLNMIEKIFIIL